MTQHRSHVKKPLPHQPPAKGCTTTAAVSLSALKHISTTACKEYGKAKSTRKSYAYYVKTGKEFLDEIVAEQLRDADSAIDGIELKLWKEAFSDLAPNKHSANALELFLTQKCLHDEHGQSTAEGIQAAFADFWDNM